MAKLSMTRATLGMHGQVRATNGKLLQGSKQGSVMCARLRAGSGNKPGSSSCARISFTGLAARLMPKELCATALKAVGNINTVAATSDANTDKEQVTVKFPRDVAGFLIGKKGASIRAVSRKANVKIDSKDEGSQRVFTIVASRRSGPKAVGTAVGILQEAAEVYKQMASKSTNQSGEEEIEVQGVSFSYNNMQSRGRNNRPNQGRRQNGGSNQFQQQNGMGGRNDFSNNANNANNANNNNGNNNNNRRNSRNRFNDKASGPSKPYDRNNSGRRKPQGKRIDASVLQKRRNARSQRKELRASKAERQVRQEIFEVPEEGMAIAELATELAVDPTEIVKVLFTKGRMAAVNQSIDAESVYLVAEYYGVEVLDKESEASVVRMTFDEEEEEDLEIRPPVVAIMGHVDHGKTTLLDYIRKSQVAEGEAGGITQSIGAYSIQVDSEHITFLDTPGHEAFSAMRARGTSVTDVVVLVVAADDGMKQQSKEALKQAQAADVPIIVAITKIDTNGAQVEKVKQELSQYNLLPEEWGGDTVIVPLSAKSGEGVQELLDAILLMSEIHEYRSNPHAPSKGTILEAHMDKSCGPVATCLVQTGTLKVGDIVTAGIGYGRVKSMLDAAGEQKSDVLPSFAVQMVGFNNVPTAGDSFQVLDDEQKARELAEKELDKTRKQRLSEQSSGSYFSMSGSIDGTDIDLKILNVILRASASGSLEAIKDTLQALPQEKVILRYLTSSPGSISQSDVDLACTSDACIIGFDVAPSEEVAAYAKQQDVKIVHSDIIYNVVNEVENSMLDLLDDVEVLDDIGEAEVLAVFGSGDTKVAGCRVTSGFVRKDCRVKVMRSKKVVFEGDLTSLRIVKDNVSEVTENTECGLGCDDFEDWQAGDKILAMSVLVERPSLA